VTVLLTISTSHDPATDLGYLLHKHPDRVQAFPQSVGTAHVFYPERTRGRCTAALLLEVDPVALVRGRQGPSGDGFALGQYVNDRPYAASSMLAMALKDVFRTAFTGARHGDATGSARASGASLRGVPGGWRRPGGVRREAHGLAGGRARVPDGGGRQGAFRRPGRPAGCGLDSHRSVFFLRSARRGVHRPDQERSASSQALRCTRQPVGTDPTRRSCPGARRPVSCCAISTPPSARRRGPRCRPRLARWSRRPPPDLTSMACTRSARGCRPGVRDTDAQGLRCHH
jgi:hypothetical protein